MRLLVSVRSAAEVAAAVAGGADIVDAKEPTRGLARRGERPVLREIARCVPAGMPFSIALGEPNNAGRRSRRPWRRSKGSIRRPRPAST